LRDILDTVFKRKAVILLIMLWCILLVLAANYVITPSYQSEAQVLVQLGREATLPPTAINQPLLVGFDRDEHINSHLQILQSRALLEQTLSQFSPADFEVRPTSPTSIFQRIRSGLRQAVTTVKDLSGRLLTRAGLLNPLTEQQRLLLAMQRSLKAERITGTQVIKVTFRSPSPVLANKFLDVFMKFYLQSAASVASGTHATMNMFMQEAAQLSDRLRAAENKLADYRRQWQIFGLNTQKDKITDELAQTATHLRQTELELNAVKRLLGERKQRKLDSVETNIPEELRKDEGVIELLKNLVRLKVRYSQAKANYAEDSPDVQVLAKEIDSLRARIATEVDGILMARQRALETRKQDLLDQQKVLMATAQTLDQRGIEMAGLERQVELLKKAFIQYSEKEEVSRMGKVMGEKHITELAVIQPPTMPIEPVSPRRMINLLLSVVVGLLLGLIYAFAREYMAGTVNRSEDLSKLIGSSTIVDLPEWRALLGNHRSLASFRVSNTALIEGLGPESHTPPNSNRESQTNRAADPRRRTS